MRRRRGEVEALGEQNETEGGDVGGGEGIESCNPVR